MIYLKYYEELQQSISSADVFTKKSTLYDPPTVKMDSSSPLDPEHIYEVDWKDFAPKQLIVIKGDITDLNGYLLDPKTRKPTNQLCKYKQANIMADLIFFFLCFVTKNPSDFISWIGNYFFSYSKFQH